MDSETDVAIPVRADDPEPLSCPANMAHRGEERSAMVLDDTGGTLNRATLTALCVATGIVAGAGVVASLFHPTLTFALTLPAVLFGAAALVGLVYAIGQYRSRTRPLELDFVAAATRPPTSANVDRLREEDAIGSAQALFFIESLIFPRSVFTRISERAEPFSRSTKVTSTYTLQIPPPPADDGKDPFPERAGDYVIPLYLASREHSVDGLRVSGADGKRVSTVDSRNLAVYVAACVRVLLDRLGKSVADAYRHPTLGLEQQVLNALSNAETLPDAAMTDLVDRVANIAAPRPAIRRAIRNLLFVALRQRIISVTVPAEVVLDRRWPHTFRYTVESRIVTGRDLPGPGRPSVPERVVRGLDVLRLALGVSILRMYLLPNDAIRTRSYHAELGGPLGTYYAEGGLLATDAAANVRVEGSMPVQHGQRRAHFHLRGASWRRTPVLAASFAERAPGSFATASMASIAAAVVLWLLAAQEIAINHAPANASTGLQQTWLLPALLAVPVAAVGLSGLDAGRQARHPSLLSRLINLATIVLSLLGFVLASVRGQGSEVPDTIWFLLRDGIAACAIVSVATWILRLAVENRFIRRSRG